VTRKSTAEVILSRSVIPSPSVILSEAADSRRESAAQSKDPLRATATGGSKRSFCRVGATVKEFVWSGHSCPLAFDFALDLHREGHSFSFEPALSKRSAPKGAAKPQF
jgi:hypothetical protein